LAEKKKWPPALELTIKRLRKTTETRKSWVQRKLHQINGVGKKKGRGQTSLKILRRVDDRTKGKKKGGKKMAGRERKLSWGKESLSQANQGDLKKRTPVPWAEKGGKGRNGGKNNRNVNVWGNEGCGNRKKGGSVGKRGPSTMNQAQKVGRGQWGINADQGKA